MLKAEIIVSDANRLWGESDVLARRLLTKVLTANARKNDSSRSKSKTRSEGILSIRGMILDSHALAASPEPFADILDDSDVFDAGSRAGPRVVASQGSDS